MPEQILVRETVKLTSDRMTETDQLLAAGYADLARDVLARARAVMEFGPPKERELVMRTVLGSMSRLAAVDSHTEIEASRTEFQQVLSAMTRVVEHPSDVDAQALAELVDDQDDEPSGPAAQPGLHPS